MNLTKLILIILCGLNAALPRLWAADLSPTASLLIQVRQLGTREAVPGAAIQCLPSGLQAEADDKGQASLQVPAGPISLSITALGYAPLSAILDLSAGQSLEKTFYLRALDVNLGEVLVKGRREKSEVSQQDLSLQEMKSLPGTGGDVMRSVQNLPGVLTAGDFSGELAVRGGGPNDNQYYLDHIPWPVPFHFGGSLSTVHSDLLNHVELYPAAFSARFGDAIGAVLEADTQPGRKDTWAASADVNLVGAQAFVQGPTGLGDLSYTLAARRSYFELFLPKIVDLQFTALPRYWDAGGSLDYNLDAHNHFRALALATDDILSFEINPQDVNDPSFVGEYRYHQGYATEGVTWSNTAWQPLRNHLSFYTLRQDEETAFGQGYYLNTFPAITGLKEDAALASGKLAGADQEWLVGGELQYRQDSAYGYFFQINSSTDAGGYNNFLSAPVGITSSAQSWQGAAYAEEHLSWANGLALRAGLRYDRNTHVADDTLGPRLTLEWRQDPATRWKAAWGLYSQFPQVQELDPSLGNPGLSPNLAQHWVLGWERTLQPGLQLSVEAYYKNLWNLVVQDPNTGVYSNQGSGDAKGIEIFLRRQAGERFFGWLSYAYSNSERLNGPGQAWQLYAYDAPQVATAVAGYKLSSAWNLSAKFRYNSGPLITPIIGRYQVNNTWYPIFGSPNSQRLGDYARLDLRTQYSWLFAGWKLNAYLEILNLLGHVNPAWIQYNSSYTTPTQVNNLPFLPYAGLSADF